jgi:quercetin dioxygenase-like cupin family protein
MTNEQKLKPGDSIYIPSGEYHNAINCGPDTVFGIDVFCPPRPNPNPTYLTDY